MAEANSTRKCLNCETPFQVKKSPGRPKKHCSDSCRVAYSEQVLRKATDSKPRCAIDDCHKPARTKGWCERHYGRWLAHGDPLYTKRHLLIAKPCAWCGEEMRLKPSQAARYRCCSHSCAGKLRSRESGQTVRSEGFWCAGCHEFSERTVRSERDSGKHCGRKCAARLRLHISRERAALRRIGERRRRSIRHAYNSLVRPEVAALRRIAKRCNDPAKNITCSHCGIEARRKRRLFRYCSLKCKRDREQARKEEYRQTDVYKAARRAAKSRRRARMRGVESESIDPIAVFERDKWKCHLCGGKTLKSKRGTIHDRAPELEHIISLSEGGTHTWGNVACSCRKCNGLKGSDSVGQLGLQIAC